MHLAGWSWRVRSRRSLAPSPSIGVVVGCRRGPATAISWLRRQDGGRGCRRWRWMRVTRSLERRTGAHFAGLLDRRSATAGQALLLLGLTHRRAVPLHKTRRRGRRGVRQIPCGGDDDGVIERGSVERRRSSRCGGCCADAARTRTGCHPAGDLVFFLRRRRYAAYGEVARTRELRWKRGRSRASRIQWLLVMG